MDVRCDRCETEYELDDGIVTDAGASVQCTTCGHTFVVTRQGAVAAAASSPAAPSPGRPPGVTPPAGIRDGAGPDVPEWTLSTDDGKVHRFRELNVLQKWIVERKVTRTERISRLGGPWLSLGDVVELAPFFAVVDEADRARAAISTPPSSRPPPGMVPPSASRGSGPVRDAAPATPPGASPFPAPTGGGSARVSEDGPTVPNRRLPGTFAEQPPSPSPSSPSPKPASPPARASEPKPGIRPPEDRTPSGSVAAARAAAASPRASARTELVFGPSITAETRLLESDLELPSRSGRKVVLAVVLLLAAGGGVWWWTQQGPGAAGGAASAAKPEGAQAHPATPAAGEAKPTATPDKAGDKAAPKTAEAKTETAKPAPAATKARPEADAKKAVPSEPVAVDAKAAATAPNAGPARGRTGAAAGSAKGGRVVADAGGPVRAGSYEQLVRDADRLLESGKSAKADKLYAQALAAHPDGVAAITGSAYVLLDRQRHFKAIETFRHALAIQPAYGPALFGIAESYRARGDTAQALGAYRQYLAVAPTGTDAPAARRQIKELESVAPPSSAERSSGPAGNSDP